MHFTLARDHFPIAFKTTIDSYGLGPMVPNLTFKVIKAWVFTE